MKRTLISALLCCAVILMALSACGDNDRLTSAGGAASSGPVSSNEETVSSEPASSTALASNEEEDSSSSVISMPVFAPETEIPSLDVTYSVEEDGSVLYYRSADYIPRVFSLNLPEDLRGPRGRIISEKALSQGDYLRLYFLEGYSIDSIDENGVAKLSTDADYAEVLFFYEPDPVHIPTLQFTHIDGMVARGGSMLAKEVSYEWDCTDENGEPIHLSQEADPPLLREDLPQIPMSGPFPLELLLEAEVKEWEVRRWDASQKGDESLPEGELVTPTPGTVTAEGVAPPEGNTPTPPLCAVVEDAAPGQIYRVTAKWEEGWVCYDFEIYQDEG